MTDFNVDSPPPGPFGRSWNIGETYIDTKTGQMKQVELNGPDTIIVVSAPKTTETYFESDLQPFSKLIEISKKRGWGSKIASGISTGLNGATNFVSDITGGGQNNLNWTWGRDKSGDDVRDQGNNDLLAWNSNGINLTENQAEKLIDKIKNSGLIELAEMIGRNPRIF